MKETISLANVAPADRLGRLQAATQAMLAELRARFPEAAGFKYKVEERLAKWAWPRGAKQSEKEIMASMDMATLKLAFRRGIRVTRGLTWGLTMDIQTIDRQMSAVKLMVLAESPLAVILGLIGLLGGIALAVAYAVARIPDWSRPNNLKLTVYVGMAIGLVLAAVGWFSARPLEGVKPAMAKELMGAMRGCVTGALNSVK